MLKETHLEKLWKADEEKSASLNYFFFLESAGELRFIILRRRKGESPQKGYRNGGTVTLPKYRKLFLLY